MLLPTVLCCLVLALALSPSLPRTLARVSAPALPHCPMSQQGLQANSLTLLSETHLFGTPRACRKCDSTSETLLRNSISDPDFLSCLFCPGQHMLFDRTENSIPCPFFSLPSPARPLLFWLPSFPGLVHWDSGLYDTLISHPPALTLGLSLSGAVLGKDISPTLSTNPVLFLPPRGTPDLTAGLSFLSHI